MPDFSPWGAAAQSGMGGYQYPQPIQQPVSGVAAGGSMPWMNMSGNNALNIPSVTPPPPMAQSVSGPPGAGPYVGAPGINGGRFNPMGQPTGISQGGMNPLMGFLLPFLMQRMGVGGAQGGVFNNPQMNGQLGSVGAPQMRPGGNMLYGPGGQPPMQTKSPFDVFGGTMGPIGPPPIQGGPVGGMPPGMGTPPALPPGSTNNFNPVTGMYTNTPSLNMPAPQAPREPMIMGPTGTPKTQAPPPPAPPVAPGSDKASYYPSPSPMPTGIPMSLQTQANAMTPQGQLQNTLNSLNPQMAALLRQQLMGQLGY